MTEYDHPGYGIIRAVPVWDEDAAATYVARPEIPAMADFLAFAGERLIGYVVDQRGDETEPSEAAPDDDDAKPYEVYGLDKKLITYTHSLRGALAVIGNSA